jgi:hypothetical protein
MIDVHFWPTGHGKKITILLEEGGLAGQGYHFRGYTPEKHLAGDYSIAARKSAQ